MAEDDDDRAWFLEQVRREQSRLRAFVRAMGVRAEVVDDLAQDALVVAFEKREFFRRAPDSDFGAWVRGIARRLIANAARKEARRRVVLSRHVTDLMLAAADAQPVHPLLADGDGDGGADPDLLAALGECVKRLPDHHREVVQLRYFEGLTPGAIAGRLERSSNQVRQMLFRVRQALLECVQSRVAGAGADGA